MVALELPPPYGIVMPLNRRVSCLRSTSLDQGVDAPVLLFWAIGFRGTRYG